MSAAKLTAADLEQWVENDEGLYRWWKRDRGSLRAFVRKNRQEIEAAVRRVLDRPPNTSAFAYSPR